MIRRYLPYIAVIWGAAIIIRAADKGIAASGSYGAGQFVAVLFAVALVVAGVRELRKTRRHRSR